MEYVYKCLVGPPSKIHREVLYVVNNVEIGRFAIYTHVLMDMSVHVEEEHRCKGIARRMIRYMLEKLKSENAYDPVLFVYIDTDASSGFWDHIGLSPNPNVDDPNFPEYGYEKRITLGGLNLV
jgi:GNAT superfamily N-acetyltransferase